MRLRGRGNWIAAALLAGVCYLVVGVVFGAFAGRTDSHQIRFAWRLAAWLVSLAAFAAHIAYEQVRRRSSPTTSALHASLGVAIGAFGLAVAANMHALATAGHRPAHTLALLLWPLVALPALVVALAAAAVLSLLRRA